MARRKQVPSSVTEKKTFATVFRRLMNDRGVSNLDLANALGFKRQTVNAYQIGQSEPRFETLVKIAKYFDVSTDYLLGITDVETVDVSARAAVEYTGLSEMAVKTLRNRAEFSSLFKLIEYLLTVERQVCFDLDRYVNAAVSSRAMVTKIPQKVAPFVMSPELMLLMQSGAIITDEDVLEEAGVPDTEITKVVRNLPAGTTIIPLLDASGYYAEEVKKQLGILVDEFIKSYVSSIKKSGEKEQ